VPGRYTTISSPPKRTAMSLLRIDAITALATARRALSPRDGHGHR
jgi:hypothetical protein